MITNYKKFSKEYKFELFYTNLIAKILCKYNKSYERYLEGKHKKNYNKNKNKYGANLNEENIKEAIRNSLKKFIIIMITIEIIIIQIIIIRI